MENNDNLLPFTKLRISVFQYCDIWVTSHTHNVYTKHTGVASFTMD